MQVAVPEVPAAQGVGDSPQVFVAQPDRHPPRPGLLSPSRVGFVGGALLRRPLLLRLLRGGR
jgi:hypothetical protein